jgi:2-alkyl-3-oxoalkanoate reductase
MKVFVAGASGAIGKRLVPVLVKAGHAVFGMTHSPVKAAAIRAAGAEPVIADALDAQAVMTSVKSAQPDAVIHELTAIPSRLNFRKVNREFALTDRLRTEGTDNLLAAARAAGTRRFVAQSFAGWPYARQGGPVKTEKDPLDSDPPPALRRTLEAIRHLETAVLGAQGMQGVVLRYAGFYGPGTSLGEGGFILDDIRKRRFPIVGRGSGIWSFIHIHDAAQATVAALQRGAPGVYNIADDEPAPVSEWLPFLAAAIGAPGPRHVPHFLAKLFVGEQGVMMMTEVRGVSNAKAKRELAWQPRWSSWRDGFRRGLSG